ncbi:MAG: hypothetical protein Ct9H300mP14_16890 [Gammaproteobacteria bacterium]|nr:MAG: hypothetical protein Ct9H300mP14_16890 [Gammaproteobacteria bacterium]
MVARVCRCGLQRSFLETIHASGGSAAPCHARCNHGYLLRHGSDEQKQRDLPKIASGDLRFRPFGVTEPTSGTDTTSLRNPGEYGMEIIMW